MRRCAAVVALLVLAACQSVSNPAPAPTSSQPSPAPGEVSATPVHSVIVADLMASCGKAGTGRSGDDYAAKVSLIEGWRSGARLKVVATRWPSHHSHSFSDHGEVVVRDKSGRIVGLAVQSGWGDTASGEGTLVIELAGCPTSGSATPVQPLADGTYDLAAAGRISPHDHVHSQQEWWVGQPLRITVEDGVVSAR